MPGQHTEYAFETAIEHRLITAGGYEKSNRDGFDTEQGICVLPPCKAKNLSPLQRYRKNRRQEELY